MRNKLRFLIVLCMACLLCFATAVTVLADGSEPVEPTAPVAVYPEGNDFSGLSTDSQAHNRIWVENYGDAYFIMDTDVYGVAPATSTVVTVNAVLTRPLNGVMFGVAPTKDPADFAYANKSGNGFADTEYLLYWHNGTNYEVAPHGNNAYLSGFACVYQGQIIGEVAFEYSVKEYGGFSVRIKVPESNTQMDCQKDEWIKLVDKNTEGYADVEVGVFGDYRGATRQSGYPFLVLNNMTVNSIEVTGPGGNIPVDSVSVEKFDQYFITNDVVEAGVIEGKIKLPEAGDVDIDTATSEGITTTAATSNWFTSAADIRGGVTAEMIFDSTGLSAAMGFYFPETQQYSCIDLGIQGYAVFKDGNQTIVEIGQDDRWAKILNETHDKFYDPANTSDSVLIGVTKLTIQVKPNGSADVYLTVLKQNAGEGLKINEPYLIAQIDNWVPDLISSGAKFAFRPKQGDWGHAATATEVKVTAADGTVLLYDDFKNNNINGNGARLWTAAQTSGYTLPRVNTVSIKNNATVTFDKVNAIADDERFTLSFNAKVTGADDKLTLFTGMTDNDTENANGKFEFGKTGISYQPAEGEAVTVASGLDMSANALISLTYVKASGLCAVTVNGEKLDEIETESFDGIMALSATDATVNYITVRTSTVDAPRLSVNLKDYYLGLNEIDLTPVVTDGIYSQAECTVTATVALADEEATVLTSMKFTPEKAGKYTVTMKATNPLGKESEEVTAQFVVYELDNQADISTKFEGDTAAFDKAEVTVSGGKATFAASGAFGTKGYARNYMQLVRIASLTGCDDFTLYFGKVGDEAYRVTFGRGSRSIAVTDDNGTKEYEIGVDVFEAIGEGSLTVQLFKMGGKLELSLLYGDLPAQSINVPVATVNVSVDRLGTIGVMSESGALVLDRFAFVNLSTYDEIPDDVRPVAPPPKPPVEDDDDNKGDGDKSGDDGCGCGGSVGASTALTAGILLIAGCAITLCTKKRKDKNAK